MLIAALSYAGLVIREFSPKIANNSNSIFHGRHSGLIRLSADNFDPSLIAPVKLEINGILSVLIWNA
jgi:hypothetical protein